MCAHYEAPKAERYRQAFRVEPPADLGKTDVWPGYMAGFIRRHPNADVGDEAVPEFEAMVGVFGMIPSWAKDLKARLSTFNARSETVGEKPVFRDAWRRARTCIIPAASIFEPDWRSGRAVATRITRTDGEPMGIAGLWSSWHGPQGDVLSFTMLTINADSHAVMRNFHRPEDEKRMVVILPEGSYDTWLRADAVSARDFLLQFPAERLDTVAAQRAA